MKLELFLSAKAFENLAKEIRRLSWGLGIVGGVLGYTQDGWMYWFICIGGWVITQIVAFGLESIRATYPGEMP